MRGFSDTLTARTQSERATPPIDCTKIRVGEGPPVAVAPSSQQNFDVDTPGAAKSARIPWGREKCTDPLGPFTDPHEHLEPRRSKRPQDVITWKGPDRSLPCWLARSLVAGTAYSALFSYWIARNLAAGSVHKALLPRGLAQCLSPQARQLWRCLPATSRAATLQARRIWRRLPMGSHHASQRARHLWRC